jgi:hypothetical protein
MSRSTASVSEGIDGVSRSRLYMRLQPVAVYHIDWAVEQGSEVPLQTGAIEDGNPSHRIEFDHEIGIALRPLIAPRA